METNRNEKIIDALIAVAVEESVMREMDSLPSHEELNRYPCSDALNAKVMKLIANADRSAKRPRRVRMFVRFAASFAFFFTIISIALMSVEASRILILNTILDIRDEFVLFEFAENNNGNVASFGHDSILEGFELAASNIRAFSSTFVYTNDDGDEIVFRQREKESLTLAIDNEQRIFSTAYMNGHEIFLFEADREGYSNSIYWTYGNYVFSVSSTRSMDDVLEIVANLIPPQP